MKGTFPPASTSLKDCVSIAELANALGIPTSALASALERSRKAINKPFYSIPDLAKRWNCSRASVYNILRESEFKLLNLSRKDKKKGKWNVPASVVEHIEKGRMESIPTPEQPEEIAA